jgi:hypothetical protein
VWVVAGGGSPWRRACGGAADPGGALAQCVVVAVLCGLRARAGVRVVCGARAGELRETGSLA